MMLNNILQIAKLNSEWVVYLPIYLFILGQIAVWTNNRIKRYNENKSYKKWVIEWTAQSIPTIELQITETRKFCHLEKISSDFPLQTIMIYPFHIKKMIDSPIKGFIDSFVTNLQGNKKDNAKMIYDLIANFNSVQIIIDEIKERHLSWNNLRKDLVNDWNRCHLGFNRMINNNTVSIVTSSHEYIPFNMNVINILNKWSSNTAEHKTNLYNIEIEYLGVLKKYVKSEAEKDIQNKYAIEVNTYIEFEMNNLIKQWKSSKNITTNWFDLKANELEEALKNIVEIQRYFSKCKTKLFCI